MQDWQMKEEISISRLDKRQDRATSRRYITSLVNASLKHPVWALAVMSAKDTPISWSVYRMSFGFTRATLASAVFVRQRGSLAGWVGVRHALDG